MRTTIVIPAYEPDEGLLDLSQSLLEKFSVLVVNDGSSEECRKIFEKVQKLGATVLSHEKNRGKGSAIKTALEYILNSKEETNVVTADADGQHSVEDICLIDDTMNENAGFFVIGKRDFSQMPARSKTGNTITRFFFGLLTGTKIYDTQSGLRGLPFSMLGWLAKIPGERYEYEINVLLSLREHETAVIEVPIKTIYINGNSSSHFRALRDGLKVFSRVAKYSLSSLVCAVIDYSVFMLLLFFRLPIGPSYAAARLLSSIINYQLNSRVVFRKKTSVISAVSYAALVLFSLAAGTLGVHFLEIAGLGGFWAKASVDIVMFVFNYIVQKKIIFRKKL